MKKLLEKKFLFPFQKTYGVLKKYWWHRLFVVLFFLSLIVIPFWSFSYMNQEAFESYSACFSLWFPDYSISVAEGYCENYLGYTSDYALISVAYFLLLFYGLQASYFAGYKVLRYIVKGSVKNQS